MDWLFVEHIQTPKHINLFFWFLVEFPCKIFCLRSVLLIETHRFSSSMANCDFSFWSLKPAWFYNPCWLACSLLFPCLCWHISVFPGTLPPTVEKKKRIVWNHQEEFVSRHCCTHACVQNCSIAVLVVKNTKGYLNVIMSRHHPGATIRTNIISKILFISLTLWGALTFTLIYSCNTFTTKQ